MEKGKSLERFLLWLQDLDRELFRERMEKSEEKKKKKKRRKEEEGGVVGDKKEDKPKKKKLKFGKDGTSNLVHKLLALLQ